MSRTEKILTALLCALLAAGVGGLAVLTAHGRHVVSGAPFGITLGASLIVGLALTVICALGGARRERG
jgi:hypothetical protein